MNETTKTKVMLKYLVALMRPKHYIKNVLIFTSIVFTKKLFDLMLVSKVLVAFLSFSLLCSVVYIINDINDREADRQHEIKKNRPIASGAVSVPVAWGMAVVLFITSISMNLMVQFPIQAFVFMALYLITNLGYSLGLKHIPILDVVLLMLGFLLRVLYGAAVIGDTVSSWVYLTVITISFYLGLGKRRNELNKLGPSGSTRKVLQFYTYAFLDKFMYLCLSLAIAFYALWSADETIAVKYGTDKLIWTVPLVIVLMMKYSADIESGSYGDPVDVILHDKVLVILSVLFGATLFGLIYIPSLLG